jgi:type I restriction enzyme S subunit
MAEINLPRGWSSTTLGSVVNYGKTDKCEFADVSRDTWVLELEDIEKESSIILKKLEKIASQKGMFFMGSSDHI